MAVAAPTVRPADGLVRLAVIAVSLAATLLAIRMAIAPFPAAKATPARSTHR